MTIAIDRRQLILGGMLGAGALTIPGFANAFTLLQASGFTHSVASGEPSATSLLLWTRYVPANRGEARVSNDTGRRPVRDGTARQKNQRPAQGQGADYHGCRRRPMCRS